LTPVRFPDQEPHGDQLSLSRFLSGMMRL